MLAAGISRCPLPSAIFLLSWSAFPSSAFSPRASCGGRRCRRRMRGQNAQHDQHASSELHENAAHARCRTRWNAPSSGFATFSPTKAWGRRRSIGKVARGRKRTRRTGSERHPRHRPIHRQTWLLHAANDPQRSRRLVKSSDRLLPFDRRKVVEKLLQGIACFEVVDQILERHSGTGEYDRTTLHVRIR